MALVRCILGKFLGVVCHCFPPDINNLKEKKKRQSHRIKQKLLEVMNFKKT